MTRRLIIVRTRGRGKKWSQPISRVLSWTIIHLRRTSPFACSNLPESTVGHSYGFLFGLAPSGVYHRHACHQPRGALLPHLFTLTRPLKRSAGGFLSAALSVGSRPPGVTWHSALWSPDFPPVTNNRRSPGQLRGGCYPVWGLGASCRGGVSGAWGDRGPASRGQGSLGIRGQR